MGALLFLGISAGVLVTVLAGVLVFVDVAFRGSDRAAEPDRDARLQERAARGARGSSGMAATAVAARIPGAEAAMERGAREQQRLPSWVRLIASRSFWVISILFVASLICWASPQIA